MAQYLTSINLNQNELQNARVQNLAQAPTVPAPVEGQIYYDTVAHKLYVYGQLGGSPAWVPTDGTATGVQSVSGSGAIGVSGTSAVTVSISAATASDPGSMSAADKTKLDAATASATGGTLVLRDSNGDFSARNLTLASATLSGAITQSTQAATKAYVDSVATGLIVHASVKAGTTPAIGDIVDLATGAPNTLDGVSLAQFDRVLVKDQADPTANGIYSVATLGTGSDGTWTRATDMDAWGEVPNAYVLITNGTVNVGTGWVTQVPISGTIGVTNIVWSQFSKVTSNTASNVGTNGVGVYHGASGLDLQFRKIYGASNKVSVTYNSTDHDIEVDVVPGNIAIADLSGTLAVGKGGTGLTTFAAGSVVAVNTVDVIAAVTSTSGTKHLVNTDGVIGWATFTSGTITSVASSGGTTGLSLTTGIGIGGNDAITASGTFTLGGTLEVSHGGTGAATLTGVVKGNGTSAFTAGNVALGSEVSGTLPILNGGTGATTASGARTNLGVPGKYSATIGDASHTSFTLTHGLGTRDVQVSVYTNGSPYDFVYADVTVATTGTVVVSFAVAPDTDAYRVVIIG